MDFVVASLAKNKVRDGAHAQAEDERPRLKMRDLMIQIRRCISLPCAWKRANTFRTETLVLWVDEKPERRIVGSQLSSLGKNGAEVDVGDQLLERKNNLLAA
jgi:hypothetical protein